MKDWSLKFWLLLIALGGGTFGIAYYFMTR